MSSISTRAEQASFVVVIVLVTVAFVWLLLPFYGAVFWAITLAILFNRVNPIIAQGAAFGAVPLMDRFEGDVTALLHTGDLLALDPEAGTVTVLEREA